MEVVGTNLIHIRIGDLCTRILFGLVDILGVNVLLR